jgi:hypothetical protein
MLDELQLTYTSYDGIWIPRQCLLLEVRLYIKYLVSVSVDK